ncbi:fat-body protein 1 [Drosophila sulfurigaster albostrigata]|uniref:fat-body protein 1 n=1 Tax=Drosophila sulfurigaster albostrigata TaxID=89887 RepID=UPI002D218A8C|nr:fat-body protein 1 [Drosophila sulfurigaster albostrigata]
MNNKLLVLFACVLSTVSAGRIFARDNQRDIDTVTQRIERLSWQDLVRQKFLLDIVLRVQEPLQDTELLQLDRGLIIDENRYQGGINEQIQQIIDLDRQRGLLTRNQIFNILNTDHVQQLTGIYNILARSIDFETLQRNAVYLRRNVNPVLFVTALTTALQSRQDSQNLIMPATLEILPELYLDEETIQRVQRTQRELDTSSRRSFIDLVGLGQGQTPRGINSLRNIFIPWRMALKRQQQQQIQNRVVLSQGSQNQADITLLTKDIGMQTFVNQLVQQLAMAEDTTEKSVRYLNNDFEQQMDIRRQQQQNEDELNMNRVQYQGFYDELSGNQINDDDSTISRQIPIRRQYQERTIGQGIEGMTSNRRVIDNIDQLPTVSINDARLLHVGRRRQQNTNRIQGRNMWNVDENDDDYLTTTIGRGIDRQLLNNRRYNDETTQNVYDQDILRQQEQINQQQNRRSTYRNIDIQDELTLDDIVEMIRRESRSRQSGLGTRSRRSLDTVNDEQTTRQSEILLQTLRQLQARLNQERVALRLSNEVNGNGRRSIVSGQDQGQRFAQRLNEMRLDSRRNRALIEQLNAIENTLRQAIGQVRRQSNNQEQLGQAIRVERALAEVVLGRLGDTGILRLLRQQLQDSNMQTDSLDLGIDINDRVLRYTLSSILNILDEQREQQLGVYQTQELQMQDVAINDVRVSELRTRLESSDVDVSNLLEQPQQAQILVRQRRLNSQPFTIDLDVSSQRAQNVIVRLMLGPREDGNLEQRRKNFVLLDAIKVQLQSGRNRIQQRSTNIEWTTRDVTPISEIYRRVMTTLRGQREELSVNELVGENGRFPQRLLLPRGRPEGLPMQLFVIISPIERQQQQMVLENTAGLMGISQAAIEDRRPLGYPLDRRIDNEQQLLSMPNVYLQDVVIVQDN